MSEVDELKDALLKTMTAWEAAAAEGIDMSLIEISLQETPAQRIRRNNDVVKFAWKLQQAMEKRDAAA
ncbi:MAG TPA: hypothetical protein VK530_21490 [Candidatus Acidoferrum sp.]|nr:hypothetical protein [Candidatus Acidoferrum sp.]